MANQTVVSAAAIWQGLFDTLTGDKGSLDFIKSGEYYFVDNNAGVDTNDGLSWDTAFKTLAYAISVSNANIAGSKAGYASRNKIFIKGDSIVEDLTVFPAKCDVIGVGSTNEGNKTRIIGQHTETGDGVIQSTGWYNVDFRNNGTPAIFTVTTFSGLYFYNCLFVAEGSCENAILTSGACDNFVIRNCKFKNDGEDNQFATTAIEIVGAMINCVIQDCYVEGAVGIKFTHSTATNCLIENCTIRATTKCIDDTSSLVVVTRNMMISAANESSIGNVVTSNVKLAAGNIVQGSGNSEGYPQTSWGPQA